MSAQFAADWMKNLKARRCMRSIKKVPCMQWHQLWLLHRGMGITGSRPSLMIARRYRTVAPPATDH